MRRAVVTGMGIWSCLGTDIPSVITSLRTGTSGIGLNEERQKYGYHSALAGKVPSVRVTREMISDRHLRASLSEQAQYALMASSAALKQSGIDCEWLKRNEMGCLIGNDTSAQGVSETALTMEREHDTQLIGYGSVFQSMNSNVSMCMSSLFGLRGASFTVSAACASGSHAIGLATMMIREGLQDIVLCGGAQETNQFSMLSFDALGVFSQRTEEPTRASRPFDKGRDGLVPSGGAAALVIEEYEHAMRRGAPILAEVVGYGFSSNGGGLSQPSVDGSLTAMQRALAQAGLKAGDVDYVNAHATSTPQGDAIEATALSQLFGQEATRVGKSPWISSTKSMTGHECWMSGASEAVYSILMMQEDFVAPNINLENPCQECAGLKMATETVECEVRTVLSNSFGFGGTNSALILSKVNK
ncbi:MAG: beta-ketoacyl-[acyl-carrier-protein] synthase family protein [Bacteroidales bacterium]|nr:beta-ketoacyl-[acyl-carrier-protein] synthase family protein [Bacteroidales bacterium]